MTKTNEDMHLSSICDIISEHVLFQLSLEEGEFEILSSTGLNGNEICKVHEFLN
jgi:hypothetical protein